MTNPKVLFIIGKGRSGSTVLDNALGGVAGFFSIGQLWRRWLWKPLEQYTCGCGAAVGACPIWSRALSQAYQQLSAETGSPVSSADVLRWEMDVLRWHRVGRLLRARPTTVSHWRALDSLVRATTAVYATLARATGSDVLIDSTKWPLIPGPLGLVPGIRAYVVHLVRDPRGVAFSWRRHKEDPDYGEMPQFGPVSSAGSWMARNWLADVVRARQGDRAMLVRYEDLMTRPRSTLTAILDHIDESHRALPLQGERTLLLGPNHNVLGNPNRFSTGSVELVADEEWRSKANWFDSGVVAALTWPLLRRYGYSLTP